MFKVIVLGSGKIGRMISMFLQESGDYNVTIADVDESSIKRFAEKRKINSLVLDVKNRELLNKTLEQFDSVISALPFFLSVQVAESALTSRCNYFDLTEDMESSQKIKEIALKAKHGQIFAPQCGLAPGFISIIAKNLCEKFESIKKVRMSVGALPQFPTGQLKYNLTWSTDGLINEYCNPCDSIIDSKLCKVIPLEGLEEFSLDGDNYEAFNTSGGLGTICETLENVAEEVYYKTIRYPGHRDLIYFLLNELNLKNDRENLKNILEKSIPVTFQDVVITFCSVSGIRNGSLVKISDARKIYSQNIFGEDWSSIQITTASSICTVIDLVHSKKIINKTLRSGNFLHQEDIKLDTFLENRFGKKFINTNIII